MNIEVAGKLGRAMDYVTEKVKDADAKLDAYIVALGALWAAGGDAAEISGKPSCLLSPQAQADVAKAIAYASLLQMAHTDVHRSLHADGDRLAALEQGGVPAQRSGPGDKIPPPK